ncbi:MAG: class I SAM-dependent methyltransferase [Burkholderiales bacterium]|nr:class I SAM-dependent methyltransferase [Burkholderiales bacterium]
MELNSVADGVCAPSPSLSHSEEYFGAYRDFWWNTDFIELMARRWQLGRYSSLLDVGCGLCHWSRLLAPHLAPGAAITALDRDRQWATGNPTVTARFGRLGASVEYAHGDAQALPFADNSFDVVTCQTVLIHLPDPLLALREMRRVVKPGGLVICVEPNNIVGAILASALSDTQSVDARCDEFRYTLTHHLAKIAAGEGDSSLGDRLHWLFHQAGFAAIRSYLSDKCAPLCPPYSGEEAQAMLDEVRDGADPERAGIWQEHVARWLEAYNDPAATAFVNAQHASQPARSKTLREMMDQGTYWDGGATMMYLVSGSK